MCPEDKNFLGKCLTKNLILSPCLEIGAGLEGASSRATVEAAGLAYFGSDVNAGANVRYVFDLEKQFAEIDKAVGGQRFGTALVLNVLEHVFDPIRVLDNVVGLLKPGGTCILATPTVWPLHKFPLDCWRINPDFYDEYARRNQLEIVRDCFEYLGYHGVDQNKVGGEYILPRAGASSVTGLWSKLVHRLFRTTGRSMFFPSLVSTGIVLRKP